MCVYSKQQQNYIWNHFYNVQNFINNNEIQFWSIFASKKESLVGKMEELYVRDKMILTSGKT